MLICVQENEKKKRKIVVIVLYITEMGSAICTLGFGKYLICKKEKEQGRRG